MRFKAAGILIVAVLAASCGNRRAEHFEALPFPDIVPPAMMEDPLDRAEYMALNMWNSLLDVSRGYPSDSVMVSGVLKTDIEQKFANWSQILGMVRQQSAEKAVGRLFEKVSACERKDTSSTAFETFRSLVEKYLFDANSPLRNEDLYGVYASRLAGCDFVSEEMRDKYARDARLCALNRTGTKAADFRFADRRGRIYTLYGINAPYTLLFFSNPGCEACMNIINVLKGNPAIARMISSGVMAVLNIYIDEDLDAWRSYMPIYPEEWYNGFDPDFVIRNETLYNVRAIPSLYLLDQEKRVILKDAPEDRLFSFLENILNR